MVTALIASIPDREKALEKTVESLRHQVDQVCVTLNDYDHVPEFLFDCKTIILDNSMGDAGKFYFAEKCEGYLLTCDDDLIYPSGYVDKMIKGLEKHPGCVVTLHGRVYSRPVVGFQQAFRGYPCLGDVMVDVPVDVGGDGCACWNSDTLKVRFSDFLQKNMSQLYFSKLCKEQNVPIICLAHREGYLKYMPPKETIWDQSFREGFVKQTALLKTFLE